MELSTDQKYGSFSGKKISEFLETSTIPMRLSFTSPKGPMIVALWFHFSANQISCCSPKDSLIVRSLEKQPEVAFDVSSNEIPYMGVRGRGKATLSQVGAEEELDNLINKYINTTTHPFPNWLRKRAAQETLITIAPEWLHSWDFSARMAGLTSESTQQPSF